MTQGGSAGQLAVRSAEAEPTAADLLDPVALERRLTEARARRAAALARRRAGPDTGSLPSPAPPPAPQPPARLAAATAPAAWFRRLPVAAIFLAGLALGAGVVLLAPLALRDRPAAPEPPAAALRVAATLPDPAPGPVPAPAPGPSTVSPPPAAGPPAATPVAADPPAPPGQAPEAAPPTWAAATRVHLHHPPDAGGAAQIAAAALRDAGVEVAILPARVTISRTNVRYYHAADAEAARGIAGLLPAGGGAAPLARDFTDFRPPPSPGMVEVWLAGEAPAAGRARAAPRHLPGAAQDVAEQVARIVADQVARTLNDAFDR